MSKVVMSEELGLPETPSPGMAQIYPGADGYLYVMTGDGIATPVIVARPNAAITSADSPYDINDLVGIVFIDASGGPVDLNLPPGADARPEGYSLKAIDAANAISVVPSGAETIDGAGGLALAAYDSARLVWNGTEWSEV